MIGTMFTSSNINQNFLVTLIAGSYCYVCSDHIADMFLCLRPIFTAVMAVSLVVKR